VIKVSQVVIHEAYDPDSVFYLLYSDILSREDGAEVDLPPVVADAPASRHGDGHVMKGIVEFFQAPIAPV